MEKTERLLDLLALLLEAKGPVSWARLKELFRDDYGQGTEDAAQRKFERDKAELVELGVPLEYVVQDDEVQGYVVDKAKYYLPDLGLQADELAVLYAAGSAALAQGLFPGKEALQAALRKIAFQEGPPPKPSVRVQLDALQPARVSSTLEQLWTAIATRKSVTLNYYSPKQDSVSKRTVNPYGLALRRGSWSLVGHCQLRGAVRTFLVHRVRALEVNALKPKSPDFEVPDGFSVDAHVASWPWQHRFHEPVDALVELGGELTALQPALLPGARPVDGERTHFRVTVTNLSGLLKAALSWGPKARVLSPATAVDDERQAMQRVLRAHEETR